MRVHLLQNDSAFRGSADAEELLDESGDALESGSPRDDDEPGFE